MRQPDHTHMPFSLAALGSDLAPATPDKDQPDLPGPWIILRENALVLCRDGHGLPEGVLPVAGPFAVPPVLVGLWRGRPLRAARLEPEAALPEALTAVSASYRSRLLDDRLMTLAGLARQVLHWRDRSRICPACGGSPGEIAGSFGARCPSCSREYYPRIHPAVIVLIARGDEYLLVRKAGWPAGQYGLVAGYVEFCETLEECVVREVLEETGLAVADVRYLASQSWPFPSQLMAGFAATYADGELVLDTHELEDAAWFSARRRPPVLPPPSSIARCIIDRFAPELAEPHANP
ncbi:MAG: NAD(+) diphosphatase [Acidobacteriota bacterium]